MSESGHSHTALHKLITVAEVIKREYIKLFTSSTKGRRRLPQRLWQYNHLSNDTSSSKTSDSNNPTTSESQDHVVDSALREHDDAIQSLVVDLKSGRKRPRQKHEPKLSIVLSTQKLSSIPGK